MTTFQSISPAHLEDPIPCLFCQALMPRQNISDMHYKCESCSSKDPIYHALTTFRARENRTVKGHLYLKLNDKSYHIRYDLENNETDILCRSFDASLTSVPVHIKDPIITVPGFPITLDNLVQKLKLYLTFS